MINESDHFMLDLDNQSAGWQTLAPMPNARNNMTGASINGKMYIISGQYTWGPTQVALSEVDCYDPATDTWSQVASMPVAISHTNLIHVQPMDRKDHHVQGGETMYNTPQSTVFTPMTTILDTWSLIGTLPASNCSTSVAGVLADGTIISATGNNPNPTADTWIGTLPTTQSI